MSFDLKKHKNSLLFLPLGGANEIGMNFNLYYYQGKWLIIDCGIGFADQRYPGVEIIVPDLQFIIHHKEDIVGMILTHAHEDHLGAVQYLWSELECPVYATQLTARVLQAKLAERGNGAKVPIQVIEKEVNKLHIGPFELEIVGLTHSIPEMKAIVIYTEIGTIFHTGDWKLDDDPVIGEASDMERLEQIGQKGVLAAIGDSTNIFNQGTSGSEGALRESLQSIIQSLNKRLVIVTTFASNIARLYSIASAAHASGRKVALLGRSLWRIYNAALESGYLQDLPPFITEKQICKYRREEILVICTGCQGEPMAAVMKLATNKHRYLDLHPKDVVIFSSKIIPGNEKRIFDLFNKLVLNNIEIMTERDHFVHVSGHPSRDEVERLYKILKPKIVIPVHGEPTHLHEHTKFARRLGAQSIEPKNGDIIDISDIGATKVGTVHSGYMAIDGHFIISTTSNIFHQRRKMQSGALMITLILKGKKLHRLLINAPGSLDIDQDREFLQALNDAITQHCDDINIDESTVSSVQKLAAKFMVKEIGKEPLIVVQKIAI